MGQEVGGVLIDAVGSGALQLLLSVAAREQAHTERPGAPGARCGPCLLYTSDAADE